MKAAALFMAAELAEQVTRLAEPQRKEEEVRPSSSSLLLSSLELSDKKVYAP